jgi:hypothetical protein
MEASSAVGALLLLLAGLVGPVCAAGRAAGRVYKED